MLANYLIWQGTFEQCHQRHGGGPFALCGRWTSYDWKRFTIKSKDGTLVVWSSFRCTPFYEHHATCEAERAVAVVENLLGRK